EGTSAAIHSNSVGMTIDYAAPEVLTGSVSAWTDQYALALTYYKLRTGMAPFQPNLAPYSRLLAHVEGTLDLSHLPAGEKAVIRRATALIPEERWTNCTEMVQALVEAIRGAETGEPEEAPPEQVTRKNVSSPRITVRPAAAKEEARQNAAPVQPPPPQPRTLPRVPPAYRWRPGARKNSTTGVLTVIVLLVALAVLAGLIVWRATHPGRPVPQAPPTGKIQAPALEPWA